MTQPTWLGSPAGAPAANKDLRFPPEPLTPTEANSLIAACSTRSRSGLRNRALLVLLYRGGLRVGEALALKVGDIDPAAGTVRVLHGKGNKTRLVGLDHGAMAVVQRWMDARRALGLRNGPLLCTLAGKHLDSRYVRALVARLAADAGIDKRVHPHGLRHSHAVELAAEGVPVNVIQRQLGHADLRVTTVYLDHLQPTDVIAAMKRRKWQEPGA